MKVNFKNKLIKIISLILVMTTFVITLNFSNITAFADSFYIGDVNGDSNVNTLDALLILKHCAQIETLSKDELACGDTDSNGVTNTADSLSILKLSANLIQSFNNYNVNLLSNIISVEKNKSSVIDIIIPFNTVVTYKSENEKIARVETNGMVSGLEVGVTVINIQCETTTLDSEIIKSSKRVEVIVEEEVQSVYKGIDVSYWQGNINWKKVKNQDVDFAIIRAGFGWQTPDEEDYLSQRDKTFEQNYQGAKEQNIPVGAYHYSYAKTVEEAKSEAEFLMDIIKNKTFEYPIFYDMEDESMSSLSKEQLTDIALAFLNTLEENGYNAGIYSNYYWVTTKLDMSRLQGYDLWIARYNDELDYEGANMWQYTSKGSIDGINGDVDLNYCYYNYTSLNKTLLLNNFKKKENIL